MCFAMCSATNSASPKRKPPESAPDLLSRFRSLRALTLPARQALAERRLYANLRTITAAAWPCGVTFTLRNVVPGEVP